MTASKYTVFFSGKSQEPPKPFIKIHATGSPNWNDFLFNFQALIEVAPDDNREPFLTSAYVMPTSPEKSAQRLNTWIASQESPQAETLSFGSSPSGTNDGNPLFITLFDDFSKYRQLTSWSTSLQERYAILAALNDVVYLRNSGFPKPVLSEILGRQSFRLGVLRSASAYRALRRGWRSVQALPVNALADARIHFRLASQMHGYDDGIHDLNVTFEDVGLFEDRVHTMIGVNGAGKTRLLRELILENGKYFETLENSPVFSEPADTEALSGNLYEGPSFNRMLVFSADTERRFPPTTRTDTSFEYHCFSLAGLEGHEMGERRTDDGGEMQREEFLSKVVVDLLRDRETFTKGSNGVTRSRFQLLRDTMREHLDMDALYLPLQSSVGPSSFGVNLDESGNKWVRALTLLSMNEQRLLELSALVDDEVELAFFTTTDGESIRKIHLSSGQKMFFQFAVRLISSIDQGTLVFVDEPETHLHPNLICDLVSLLYEVLTQMKSIALVATHSAYVVREVPTHCVHVFNFLPDSKSVQIGRVRLKTLGASIDRISQAIFGDATVEKYHERIAREIAQTEVDPEVILNKYESLLSAELLIEIRALMEEGDDHDSD